MLADTLLDLLADEWLGRELNRGKLTDTLSDGLNRRVLLVLVDKGLGDRLVFFY